MIPIGIRNETDNALNPKRPPTGVKGKISVSITVKRVAIDKYLDGLLLKKGLRLRMTRTTSDAEHTDSRNHPVLN